MEPRYMTKEERAAAREAIAAATPGPWEFSLHSECTIAPHVEQVKPRGGRYTIATPVHSNPETEANMRFIALAHRYLPAALDALEKAEAELAAASYPGHYISTACQRGKHEHCRLTDKWTGEPCLCSCGHPGTGEPTTTYDELKSAIAKLEKEAQLRWEKWDAAVESDIATQARNKELHAQLATANCDIAVDAERFKELHAEIARKDILCDKEYADAMIAHRFVEALVGEHARGRDFAVKVPMLAEVISRKDQTVKQTQLERDNYASQLTLVTRFLGDSRAEVERLKKALEKIGGLDGISTVPEEFREYWRS